MVFEFLISNRSKISFATRFVAVAVNASLTCALDVDAKCDNLRYSVDFRSSKCVEKTSAYEELKIYASRNWYQI